MGSQRIKHGLATEQLAPRRHSLNTISFHKEPELFKENHWFQDGERNVQVEPGMFCCSTKQRSYKREWKWRKPMWIMGLHPVTNIFSVDIPREEREKGQETYFKKFPGGRFKGEGTYVYLWLDHVDVWLRPTQYCKAIILQLKIDWRKEILKSRTRSWTSVSMNLLSPCIDVTQRRFFEDTL